MNKIYTDFNINICFVWSLYPNVFLHILFYVCLLPVSASCVVLFFLNIVFIVGLTFYFLSLTLYLSF